MITYHNLCELMFGTTSDIINAKFTLTFSINGPYYESEALRKALVLSVEENR